MDEILFWVAYFFADLIIYPLGRMIIFFGTFGYYKAEPRDRRDEDNIDSYTLADREVSQEITWLVGGSAFALMIAALIYYFYNAGH